MKKNTVKKTAPAALVCGLAAAGILFAGCTGRGTSGTGAEGRALDFSGYPMNVRDLNISWWTEQYTLGGLYASAAESPFHSGLAEHIGVTIDWRFPTEGTPASQAFNLMLADNVLPDIIAYGGIMPEADRYIDEGLIMDISPYIEKWAPHYYAYLRENPALDRAAKTDSGKYYGFVFFREDWGWNDTYQGPIIRKDWLDECGLPVPETIGQWENTLRTFKQKYGAVFAAPPWRFNDMGIAGAFGAYSSVNFKLYVDRNGKIQCTNISPEYKNYLARLNQWWNEGLMDPDFPASTDASLRTKALNGKIGIAYSALSQLSTWREDAAKAGSTADWIGIPFPTADDGSISAIFGGYGIIGFPAAVSASVPPGKLEAVLRALDYGYSPEGILYWNFGARGLSWDYDSEGKIVYTALVTEDPAGLATASARYAGAVGYGTCVQTTRLIQLRLVPEGVKANDTWYYTHQDVSAYHTLPPGVSFTAAESARRAELQTALGTYASEMAMKFITGQEPLRNFNAFTDRINQMGAAELIGLTQDAYGRYIKR
jgi:putative aldouronate transport system substrate-binding protein